MQFPVLGTELQLLALGDPVEILVAYLEDPVQALQTLLGQEDQDLISVTMLLGD